MEELDLWLQREDVPDDPRIPVLNWIISRMDDPYLNAHRAGNMDNLWWAQIPNTRCEDERVATGSYFIVEREKLVRCNSFSLLSPPFL